MNNKNILLSLFLVFTVPPLTAIAGSRTAAWVSTEVFTWQILPRPDLVFMVLFWHCVPPHPVLLLPNFLFPPSHRYTGFMTSAFPPQRGNALPLRGPHVRLRWQHPTRGEGTRS